MPDITKGYTFSDSKADWASEKETALRLNKMVDDAKVNLVAGSNISISRGSSGITISAAGGGTGTVTNVSVVSSNGVSGTVANPTTTPAITLALGTITPTSVAAAGTVTGSNLSGTNTGDQTITLTSDVTGSGTGSFATTIANGVVTNAKLANVATATFKGRTTAGTGSPEDLTAAQATALLDTFNSSTKGLVGPSGGGTTSYLRADGTFTSALTPASVAASGTVGGSNLSGTNTGDQTITLTGDVTGSGTGSFAATIANQAVTNAKLANVATATFKGRTSAGTGSPEDLTGSQATALLDQFTSAAKGVVGPSGGGTTNFLRADGTWAVPSGGSGTVTSVSVVSANGVSGTVSNPTTTPAITLSLGAITPTSVASTGTVTGTNLSGTNTGDQTITLTSDVTGSGTGSFATTIAAGVVTNAKLANVATATFKGRTSSGTGSPEDLTATQATALLNTFTSSLKGLAPSSGGGTANFLRADGTWANPGTGAPIATTGPIYSRLVKTIAGTITAATDTKWSFPELYNVRDYGATGDGTTDDTTAIQAAITAACAKQYGGPYTQTSPKGAVYFPAGKYVISSALTITAGFMGWLRIFGEGPRNSVIYQTTTGQNCLESLQTTNNTTFDHATIYISDIGFEAGPNVVVPYAIRCKDGKYNRFENITINCLFLPTDTRRIKTGISNENSWYAFFSNIEFIGQNTTYDNAEPTYSTFRGAWFSGITYSIGDGVIHNGNKYVSKTNSNVNNTPPATASNTNWDIINPNSAIYILNSTNILISDISIVYAYKGITAEALSPSYVNYTGGWSSLTTYAAGDGVIYTPTDPNAVATYYASRVGSNTNNIPPSSDSNAYWYIISPFDVFQGLSLTNINIIQASIGIDLIGNTFNAAVLDLRDANGQMSISNYLFDSGNINSQSKSTGIRCSNIKEIHLSNYQAFCNTVNTAFAVALDLNNTYRSHFSSATVVTSNPSATGIKGVNGTSDNTFSDIRFDGFNPVINLDSTSNYNYMFSSRYGYAGNLTWNVTNAGTGNVLNRMG